MRRAFPAAKALAVLGAVGASCAWLAGPTEARTDARPSAPDPGSIAPGRSPGPGLRPDDGAAAAAADSIQGLVLLGISGSAGGGLAVLGSGDGSQRVVPVGRQFLPGATLRAVGLDHAIVVQGSRTLRLELRRYGAPAGGTGGIPLGETPSSEADQRLAAKALANELTPVRSNGRIGGYALRRAANLPRLREAGLREGDVILSVNGSQLDEERMGELVWELNNASKADFVYLRNGKQMRLTL